MYKPNYIVKYIFIIIFFLLFSAATSSQTEKSLVLNGCTDFLEIVETDLLDFNNAISIEAWIAPNCDDGNRVIVGKEWCGGEMSYYFSVFDGKLFWRFSNTGYCGGISSFQSVNQVIPTDVFTHVAVVHDQSEVKFFVNGLEVAGTYVDGSFTQIFNSNQEFRIGTYKNIDGSFGNHFSGLIDEMRVWDIALNQNMILSNMNNTLTGNENGLILYLDMESTTSGSNLSLNNLANIPENLTAIAAGFTSETPYFEYFTEYNINPINFLDEYLSCEEDLILIFGDNNYKNINWSTGSQSNSTSIPNPGTYSVTIETELCKFFSHTFEFIKLEKVWEEENIYICSEDTYEFQGQLLPVNSSVEFLLAGVDGCDTTLTINVFELPDEEIPFLGNDITSCHSTVSLFSPYENTVWNNEQIGQELLIDSSGVYHAIATDELGCKFIDSINVIFEIPYKEINVEICTDDFYPFNGELLPVGTSMTFLVESPVGCDTIVLVNVTEIAPQSTNFLGDDIISCTNTVIVVSPFTNTSWSNGFVGSGLWVDQEGDYYATGTDEFGCTYLDTINVVFDIPIEEITVEICKDDFYPFDGQMLEVNTSSTFLIENMSGCDTTFIIHVLEIPTQESSFLGEDIVSCNATISLVSPYENTIWNDDINSPELMVSQPGVYYAYATDNLGCSFTDSVLVTIETPTKDLTVEICKDDVYLFYGQNLEVNTSSTFLLEDTDGCDTILTIHVLETPPIESFFLGEDIISCTDQATLVSPYQNTVWGEGYIGNGILVKNEGVYHATATDEFGCVFYDSVEVSFEINTKEISVSICKEDFFQYNGELFPPNSLTTLIIENANGCDTTATIEVNAFESIDLFEETAISICDSEIKLSSPFETTIWNDDYVGSEYLVQSNGFTSVEAVDSLGCTITDSIYVELLDSEFYLPNVIAKKSQVNNCFKPVFSSPSSNPYTLQIFDRWGGLMFSETGKDIAWCGYHKNKFVANGVYVYIIELSNACNNQIKKIGTLTVI